MDVQVAWAWEMSQVVYLYTQLYIMPLILMVVLSAMTIFRREMSCNHIYALEGGSRRSAPPRPLEDNHQVAPSVLSPYVESLFSNLMWLRFDRGDSSDEDPALSSSACLRTNPVSNQCQQQQNNAPDTLRDRYSDFLRLQWTENAQQTLDGIMEKIPQTAIRRLSEASLRMIPMRQRKTEMSTPLHPENFPADVQVNIMSFLQPKDVVKFACVNRSCRAIVDGEGPTTTAVWKTLWERDYGWLIHSWQIGRQAYLRSKLGDDQEPHGKEFYFRFGLSYVNYLLAGLNTPDHCFVGLHGNIYDITDFVIRHPGSPETLFVHAGRDATKLFDDMDHSKGARRLAKEFCIAVDMSYEGSFGLRPTMEFEADGAIPPIRIAKPVIGKKERRLRQPECLRKIHDKFIAERHQYHKDFSARLKDDTDVLHWTLYFDPYQGAWKAWYTSRDFKTVFVSHEATPSV